MQTVVWWRTDTVPDNACVVRRIMTTDAVESQRAFSVTPADYRVDYALIRSVRFEVFVNEQAVPADLEMDERDPQCFHVLARDTAGHPVGTGRIDIEAGGRLGRMAVLAQWRSAGVGTQIIAALHDHARAQGHLQVWCHAQVAARRFYERAGYKASGATFLEAGIEHITMRCTLEP